MNLEVWFALAVAPPLFGYVIYLAYHATRGRLR